ncbi:fucose-1-phosphate guanylyltransferase [Scleropages formosus]|uniref:Fucose-1-phosphate guanylyltransferase n=1 Tax=Scleropages formosus TaxID=113540 RepID=A0A8C9RAK7_SCLFO|nr:fucose-1-phosphate guanylyltransferase [Scleropages formosus]
MNKVINTELQRSTEEKLRKFQKLRGHEVRTGEFWDVVVVTAVDEEQKRAFEAQISGKLRRKELPLGVRYHVFADPPGPKIGNGGSTLYALRHLETEYGQRLSGFRIILIHAGGLSQRLPNASALGKIFLALPLGDPVFQMLELKLAIYVDFPLYMKPGIVVTCADDIELYSISETENIAFDRSGFTALAHPSSLSIGSTHGVFVLEPEKKSKICQMEYRSCYRFLHKPSIDEMHSSGAVCNKAAEIVALNDSEFVYTDSTYYVDHTTTVRLLALLKVIEPLCCEIDAYGDFLQALGPGATSTYTQNSANVTEEENNLIQTRQKIFHELQGMPLNVILLNNSKFYHVGTTREYLFHFTKDHNLRAELGLVSNAFSICPREIKGSCIMHSVVHPSCDIASGSVIEYSRLDANVTVEKGTIISGCQIGNGFRVPSGVFMHSLSVSISGATTFVTVSFAIEDNLKQSLTTPKEINKLHYFGVSLEKCLDHWGISVEELKFSGDRHSFSLWNARIFPQCSDLSSSFEMSLQMIYALRGNSNFRFPKDVKLLSLQEILKNKNLEEMLKFRQDLYNDISENQLGHS